MEGTAGGLMVMEGGGGGGEMGVTVKSLMSANAALRWTSGG